MASSTLNFVLGLLLVGGLGLFMVALLRGGRQLGGFLDRRSAGEKPEARREVLREGRAPLRREEWRD